MNREDESRVAENREDLQFMNTTFDERPIERFL